MLLPAEAHFEMEHVVRHIPYRRATSALLLILVVVVGSLASYGVLVRVRMSRWYVNASSEQVEARVKKALREASAVTVIVHPPFSGTGPNAAESRRFRISDRDRLDLLSKTFALVGPILRVTVRTTRSLRPRAKR